MIRRLATFAGILLLLGCGGSSGPFITPPLGTLGYQVLGTTYLGASIADTSGNGSSASVRLIPTFNTPDEVTVWLPGVPTVGSHLTSDLTGGYFVSLNVSTSGENEDGQFGSPSGGGTIDITSVTLATTGQLGHVTGTFASVVRNSFGQDEIISNGTFDADYDAPN